MTLLQKLRHRLSASLRLDVERLTKELQKSHEEVLQLRGRVHDQRQHLDSAKRRIKILKQHMARREAQPATAHFSRKPFARPDAGKLYTLTNVVSYPKCGRTWLAHLYVHYTRYHLDAKDLPHRSLNMPERNAAFQAFLAVHAREHRFPVCLFTHLGFSSLKPFETSGETWPDKARTVLKRPTVLIVRDPRDVLASHYHPSAHVTW
jgi:hypothetical protein